MNNTPTIVHVSNSLLGRHMNYQFLFLFLFATLMTACGGGNSTTDAQEALNTVENNLPSDSVPSAIQDEPQEQDNNQSIPAPTETPVAETPPETDTTEPMPSPPTEPAPEPAPPVVPLGYTNQIPSCTEAGNRIQASIEIGMSPAQVRSLVGRPLNSGVSGDRWGYGRGSFTPEIIFQAILVEGALMAGPVTGYDSDVSGCDYYQSDIDFPLIEAANSLAIQNDIPDFTTETPTCLDAGIRVSALVENGMTPEEVRKLVGKPIEISLLGTHWDYGDGTFTPELWFSATIENGVYKATVLRGWDGDIRGCD